MPIPEEVRNCMKTIKIVCYSIIVAAYFFAAFVILSLLDAYIY